MKIFNWKKDKNMPHSDPYLYERLNTDMNYCGLTPEIQKGFLFFLGAAINVGINESPVDLSSFLKTEAEQKETMLKIIHGYSMSSGDFNDYGDLNDLALHKAIFNFSHVLYMLGEQDPQLIKSQLKKIEISSERSFVPLSSEPDLELVSKYEGQAFNLNICHNLLEDTFKKMGEHLQNNGYDNKRSYEAGYAYFCLKLGSDLNGITFLLKTILDSFTPLYKALFSYPVLNFAYPEALKSNHVFSNSLQMFYSGINQQITQPIHKFHQLIFYTPNSSEFRPEWDFTNRDDKKNEIMVFMNALAIRKTNLIDLKDDFLNFNDFMLPELKNMTLDKDEFYARIRFGITQKYGLQPVQKDVDIWNNLGELIQYYGILFYETCLHAMVLDKIEE